MDFLELALVSTSKLLLMLECNLANNVFFGVNIDTSSYHEAYECLSTLNDIKFGEMVDIEHQSLLATNT